MFKISHSRKVAEIWGNFHFQVRQAMRKCNPNVTQNTTFLFHNKFLMAHYITKYTYTCVFLLNNNFP